MHRDQFQICNQLSELSQIQKRLECFLKEHGLQHDLADEMMLIAEELIVNTIEYGYQDQQQHLIDIEFQLEPNQKFAMVFCDDARPFNPLIADPPTLGLPSDQVDIGGLGIPLIMALSDQQDYQHHQGKNILRILKSLESMAN